MELKKVVVTGLGALTPIGNDIPTFWDNLLKGVSGAGPITIFDASKFKTRFACEVKNFDPLEHFDRKEVRKLDRCSQFAIVAARQAIADARFDLPVEDMNRIGVICGIGIGGLGTFEQEFKEFYAGDGTPRFSPFFIPKMIADISAGHISMEFGFRGPNYTTVSACASGTNALANAFDTIRLGKADVMISGGAEAAITLGGVGGFNSMHALSTRNDSPETASRPFSASRDGFVMGEGAGFLVLEELEHAKKRGARIYAEVIGSGATADAHHLTAPHPEGAGAALVMQNALLDAGIRPEDVDYINVHGTSTPAGDVAELKAIKQVFGEHAYRLNISSTKSMTGHLLGATGAVEAIACVLATVNDIVPPTTNFTGERDENIDYNLNLTFDKPQKRPVRVALSNTFGFGGHNASILVRKYQA